MNKKPLSNQDKTFKGRCAKKYLYLYYQIKNLIKMKKQLLCVFTLLVTSIAFSQTIPNGGFESWTTTNYEEPTFFMSANQQNINNGVTSPLTVVKTTDAYHGTYAVKMTTLLSGNDTLQAFIADGNPGSGPPQGGVPYTQQPVGLRFHYKCNIIPGDSAIVIAMFYKSGSIIGQYLYHITGTQSSYTLFSQTFSPALTQAPDTVLFACASSNLMAKVGISAGSMLQIDSVSYTGVSSQPANFGGDFETWQTTINNSPNGWNSSGAIQSISKYSGTYALELITTPPGFGNNQPEVGDVQNTQNSNSGPPTGGAPYSTQVDTLVFYYKYAPANYPISTDSARVGLSFSKHGVGNIWGTQKLLGYSHNYLKVEMPFNLSQVPDTVQISIQSSSWPVLNSYIGSDLIIDQFYFKSQAIPVSNFIMPATGCKGVPIQLTDNSSNMPTTWTWFMTNSTTGNNSSLENPVISYSNTGTYTVSLQAADSFGVSTFISKTITINSNPFVSATSPTICLGNHGLMTASGAVTYTWNMGAMAASIFVSPTVTTTYSVTGTGANGCKDSATSTVSVLPPQIPSICMVSTDSTTNYKYNIVYWNNTNLGVDSFIVYRLDNSSGNYLRIGAVNKDSLSQFVDKDSTTGGPHGGNPQYASWKYKLQIRDTCGNYGSLSPYHQSVFFTQSASVFNFSLYIDSGYASLPTGYGLYRDDNNTGNFQPLVVVGSSPANDPNYRCFRI